MNATYTGVSRTMGVRISRRNFISGAAALAAMSGFTDAKADGYAKGPRFEFGKDDLFRLMQITDLHLRPNGRKLHPRAVRVMRTAFAKYRPSLIVLTGDNVCGKGSIMFEETISPLVALFREHKIPFCVTFGNHDAERKGPGEHSRQQQYDIYKKLGGDIFVDHDVPELFGVGNGVVHICRRGKSAAAFNLFVMDSGDYPDGDGRKGYEGCRSDQIAWYERVSGSTPCLWFQHIIVPDANVHGLFIDAPKSDNPKAKEGPMTGYDMMWPEGNRRMLLAPGVDGVLKEHTCPPRWETYRDAKHTFEGRTLYDSWRKMGNMKGAFFGHDHMNSFVGTDRNGIRIGMTKCCSLWTYHDDNIGVRSFTLRPDGTYDTEIFTETDLGRKGK